MLGNDDCSEGAFLIRDGQNARCERVLSVRLVEKEVGHFRIYKDQVNCELKFFHRERFSLSYRVQDIFFMGRQNLNL